MTTLTIELPKESYELLQIEAERVGHSIQGVAQKLLMAQTSNKSSTRCWITH